MGWLLDSAAQVFTRDFWGRLLTRPWEAVLAHPDVAWQSAAVAGGGAAAGGLAIMAAPAVASAAGTLLAGARVAAAPVSWAARHPIASYLLVTQSDLPTEIVRAWGASGVAPWQSGAVPPTSTAPAPVQSAPVRPAPVLARGPVARPDVWGRMFGW